MHKLWENTLKFIYSEQRVETKMQNDTKSGNDVFRFI